MNSPTFWNNAEFIFSSKDYSIPAIANKKIVSVVCIIAVLDFTSV